MLLNAHIKHSIIFTFWIKGGGKVAYIIIQVIYIESNEIACHWGFRECSKTQAEHIVQSWNLRCFKLKNFIQDFHSLFQIPQGNDTPDAMLMFFWGSVNEYGYNPVKQWHWLAAWLVLS